MNMSLFVKIAVRLLVWPLMLVVCLYVVLLWTNRHDQSVGVAAAQFEQRFSTRATIGERDNGHTYVLGWHWSGPSTRAREDPMFKVLTQGCSALDTACRKLLYASDREIALVVKEQAWLLERYQKLLEHPGWQVPLPLDLVQKLPDLVETSDGQRLLMLKVWQLAREGKVQQVRQLLAADHQFWRMVVASNEDLITTMFAASLLKRNFEWGSIVLSVLPRTVQAAALPPQWRTPVSIEERSLRRVLLGEYLFTKKYNDEMAGVAALSDDPLDWATWSLTAPLFSARRV